MNIGIYIYPEAEVLDFAGPFEVFSTASRVQGAPFPFNVFLIAESTDRVLARAGFKVLPDYSMSNHPELDVLIIVGGMHLNEMEKPDVIQWISTQAKKVSLVASVCTGAFLLAKAGVITTEKVTTHWEDIPALRQQFPALNVIEKVRWVHEPGHAATSGGISASIDMSLHLVAYLHSLKLAENTARQMEFDWCQNSGR